MRHMRIVVAQQRYSLSACHRWIWEKPVKLLSRVLHVDRSGTLTFQVMTNCLLIAPQRSQTPHSKDDRYGGRVLCMHFDEVALFMIC
mmetsp:Transcript_5470/g.7613  ORF Transcript_5470/g.7613 Transcript_5470/m.7613 type:complete len:87 (+) Transcript_5470:914-1174(+)